MTTLETALAGVLDALERLTLALPGVKTDTDKLALYRRCYRQIINEIDKLDDAQQRRLLRM